MSEQLRKSMPKEWLRTLLTIMENQYHVTAILRAFVVEGRTQSHPKTTQTAAQRGRLATQEAGASPQVNYLW